MHPVIEIWHRDAPLIIMQAGQNFDRTRAGFMAAPPYMPECKSLFGPVILISSPNKPRSMVTMAGVLLSNNPVSQINTISDVSSAAFSFMKGIKLGDPLSSSPSKKKVILQGNVPCTAFPRGRPRQRSSIAPYRRTIRARGYGTFGRLFNGRIKRITMPQFNGINRLHIIMSVKQDMWPAPSTCPTTMG